MFTCKYCGNEFETKNKYARHAQLCEKNPNVYKIECPTCHEFYFNVRFKTHHCHGVQKHMSQGWAKGLTKETSDIIARQSEHLQEYYKTHSGAFKGRHHSEETKQLISQKLTAYNHANQKRNLHSKGGYYNEIYFMSTWELAYYLYMLDTECSIQRCEQSFIYTYQEKEHKYTPDFMVDGVFIEIKGKEIEKDKAKYQSMLDNNIPFKVLYEKDINPCIKYVKQKYQVKKITELYQDNQTIVEYPNG